MAPWALFGFSRAAIRTTPIVKDNFIEEILWEIEKYISSALMEIDIGRILISGKETSVGMYYKAWENLIKAQGFLNAGV